MVTKVTLKNIDRGKYFRIVAEVYSNKKSLTLQLRENNLGVVYRGGKKFERLCL